MTNRCCLFTPLSHYSLPTRRLPSIYSLSMVLIGYSELGTAGSDIDNSSSSPPGTGTSQFYVVCSKLSSGSRDKHLGFCCVRQSGWQRVQSLFFCHYCCQDSTACTAVVCVSSSAFLIDFPTCAWVCMHLCMNMSCYWKRVIKPSFTRGWQPGDSTVITSNQSSMAARVR